MQYSKFLAIPTLIAILLSTTERIDASHREFDSLKRSVTRVPCFDGTTSG